MTPYTVLRVPPPNRVGRHLGTQEEHLPEAGVMLAFAVHLVDSGAEQVALQPDGEHGKRFDFPAWFTSRDYAFTHGGGRTAYAGIYQHVSHKVVLKVQSGVGDVVAAVDGRRTIAECKGGILNTTHPGQRSKLRRGLCEAVGLLMSKEQGTDRHVAVVPYHDVTLTLAKRMAERVRRAGIEIALVKGDGSIVYVQ